MKKKGSEVEPQSVVKEVVIRTSDKDGRNVVNISLRVAEDGQIAEMFGVGPRGQKWEVKRIKFSLRKPSSSKKPKPKGGDNDECKCCSHVPEPNGPVRCVNCSC